MMKVSKIIKSMVLQDIFEELKDEFKAASKVEYFISHHDKGELFLSLAKIENILDVYLNRKEVQANDEIPDN